MEVFDLFTTTSYTFNQLAEGGVAGNRRIANGATEQGIFTMKRRVTRDGNGQEITQSDARLKIAPDAAIVQTVGKNMQGQEVTVEDVNYRIEDVSEGKDHDSGEVLFYTLSLKIAEVVA